MTTHTSSKLLSGVVLIVGSLCAWSQATKDASPRPPAELVKDVIYNELHAPHIPDIHWRYQLYKETDGNKETRIVVETKSGSLDRLFAVEGKPLTGSQAAKEEARILKFSRSEDEQKKAEQARNKDAEQCSTILQMIPAAFIFEYAGDNGNSVKLVFKPNPSFRPPSREGKVLQQMAGEMWVDGRQKRLISINGQLLNEVKFGGGLLGRLEKGGQFAVKRAEIAPGDWEMTELTVNMQGKALLFKSISVQQKEIHSEFQRLPDNLGITDAANVLLHQTLVASRNVTLSAGQP